MRWNKTKIREPVMRFAFQMEKKLREHDASRKDSWRKMSPQALFKRLCTEVEELGRAWDQEDKRAECVDIANFTMFLWNYFESEAQIDGGGKSEAAWLNLTKLGSVKRY